MIRIEFVGSSAVGKTALFNYLLKNRVKNDIWLSPDEARIKIAKRFCNVLLPISRRGMIKYGILPKEHSKWAISILESYKNAAIEEKGEKYSLWAELFYDYINKKDTIKKLFLSDMFFKKLCYDVILLEYFEIQNPVIFEESITTLNGGLKKSALMSYNDDPRESIKIKKSRPDGIIYCNIEPDDNFKRLKQKVQQGNVNYSNIRLNDEQLMKRCIGGLQMAKNIADTMKYLGVKNAEVDMTKSLKTNSFIINEFIRSFY